MTEVAQQTGRDPTPIRPFRINVPEPELAELRRRINATRWPDRETVSDTSQGVALATIQELARHWATDYDWRKCEAKLNALPQFITQIDGVDVHFIHVRSKHENAAEEHRAYLQIADLRAKHFAYAVMMTTRPQNALWVGGFTHRPRRLVSRPR